MFGFGLEWSRSSEVIDLGHKRYWDLPEGLRNDGAKIDEQIVPFLVPWPGGEGRSCATLLCSRVQGGTGLELVHAVEIPSSPESTV
ncbi:hypothetical protein N7520_006710 [Penicillium odoratum]|uniref:uncharacterized protein n=1 Tax=Penicillium odoratum TaxID=1167516 RepID=UPI0025480C94|nr:uncharacterized protein N7520_006710 [Penicillium odoratum]KAJ5759554.1 hypothetical protein N7520_006710 [Penicillium odoratum]